MHSFDQQPQPSSSRLSVEATPQENLTVLTEALHQDLEKLIAAATALNSNDRAMLWIKSNVQPVPNFEVIVEKMRPIYASLNMIRDVLKLPVDRKKALSQLTKLPSEAALLRSEIFSLSYLNQAESKPMYLTSIGDKAAENIKIILNLSRDLTTKLDAFTQAYTEAIT